MTHAEYQKKRDNIARSEATVNAKAAAIEALDESFLSTDSVAKAKRQFEESRADLPKEDN